MCAASACAAPSPRASRCHHHSDKGNNSGEACQQHPHTDFLSPEDNTDLAKLASFPFMGVLALPATGPLTALDAKPAAIVLHASAYYAPPARGVLARLSTFRI
jgi:hypothetical protein